MIKKKYLKRFLIKKKLIYQKSIFDDIPKFTFTVEDYLLACKMHTDPFWNIKPEKKELLSIYEKERLINEIKKDREERRNYIKKIIEERKNTKINQTKNIERLF